MDSIIKWFLIVVILSGILDSRSTEEKELLKKLKPTMEHLSGLLASQSTDPELEDLSFKLTAKEKKLARAVCENGDASRLKAIAEGYGRCVLKNEDLNETQIQEFQPVKQCSKPSVFCEYKSDDVPLMKCLDEILKKLKRNRQKRLELTDEEAKKLFKCYLKNSSTTNHGTVLLLIVGLIIGSGFQILEFNC